MKHLDFFGFIAEPFFLQTSGKSYYKSVEQATTLARVIHAVADKTPLIEVVGNKGAGKTTLARMLFGQLAGDTYCVVLANKLPAEVLLRKLARHLKLHMIDEALPVVALRVVQAVTQLKQNQKQLVVIFDDYTQNEFNELLGYLRHYIDVATFFNSMTSVVFVRGMYQQQQGLPVPKVIALEGFSLESVQQYIRFRLRWAGVTQDVFSPWAVKLISKVTQGLPTYINFICDQALIEAYLLDKKQIDHELIYQVCIDTDLKEKIVQLNQEVSTNKIIDRPQMAPGLLGKLHLLDDYRPKAQSQPLPVETDLDEDIDRALDTLILKNETIKPLVALPDVVDDLLTDLENLATRALLQTSQTQQPAGLRTDLTASEVFVVNDDDIEQLLTKLDAVKVSPKKIPEQEQQTLLAELDRLQNG